MDQERYDLAWSTEQPFFLDQSIKFLFSAKTAIHSATFRLVFFGISVYICDFLRKKSAGLPLIASFIINISVKAGV